MISEDILLRKRYKQLKGHFSVLRRKLNNCRVGTDEYNTLLEELMDLSSELGTVRSLKSTDRLSYLDRLMCSLVLSERDNSENNEKTM